MKTRAGAQLQNKESKGKMGDRGKIVIPEKSLVYGCVFINEKVT